MAEKKSNLKREILSILSFFFIIQCIMDYLYNVIYRQVIFGFYQNIEIVLGFLALASFLVLAVFWLTNTKE